LIVSREFLYLFSSSDSGLCCSLLIGIAGDTSGYKWEATAKAVVTFAQRQEVDAADIEKIVHIRKRRAAQRASVLSRIDSILESCTEAKAVLPALLSKTALAISASPRARSHYSHGLAVHLLSKAKTQL